jgi:hypothetical protein
MTAANSASQSCVACGYDLAGRVLGETFPECGGTVVENPFRGAWQDVAVRRSFKFGAWALVVGAVLVAAALALVLRERLSWFSGLPATPGYASPVLEALLGVITLGAVPAFLIAVVVMGAVSLRGRYSERLAMLLAAIGACGAAGFRDRRCRRHDARMPAACPM